jgi:hypothetical protein
MKHAEPPEPPSSRSHVRSSTFLLGQNRRGQWVVQEQRHRCGGLFINRNEALKFALFENGNQPQAVIMVPGILELDMNDQAATAAKPAFDTDAVRLRRVA